MGDKVDSSAKEEITKAIADVRESLTSEDAEEIKAKTDALQAAFHKVSEQIYQAAAEQQQAAGGGPDRWRRRRRRAARTPRRRSSTPRSSMTSARRSG